MKQIIPFKKDLPFKTKVSEITSISLEREITVEDEGIVTGVFHITGDYKMNEGSINRETFSFDLPFDITLDPRYDINSVSSDIEDFYYDIENEDTLKVNIDLFIEAEYLPEKEKVEIENTSKEIENIKEDEYEKNEDRKSQEIEEIEDITLKEENKIELSDKKGEDNKLVEGPKEERNLPDEKNKEPQKEDTIFKEEITEPTPVIVETNLLDNISSKEQRDNSIAMPALAADLFSNLDDTETYTTYYVYIVKEEDTIDKILVKYGVTKEDLEAYNDIAAIKPGDKIIVPKTSE